MYLSHRTENGIIVVDLSGELDHHAARECINYIENVIDMNLPKNLDINLARLGFMDSSGLAVVMGAYRRMKSISGRLRVTNAPRHAIRVLNASGLNKIVNIE